MNNVTQLHHQDDQCWPNPPGWIWDGCRWVPDRDCQPCPPSPPPSPSPCPPPANVLSQMPQGVTNGSNAQPGQVGEYWLTQAQIVYQQGVPLSVLVGMGTLPPGDWNFQLLGQPGGFVEEFGFLLEPTIPGFEHTMGQAFATGQPVPGGEEFVLLGAPGRALTSVPSAIVVRLHINSSESGGTAYLYAQARRMR